MQSRRVLCGAVLCVAVLAIAAAGSAGASPQRAFGPLRAVEEPGDVHHDVSPPLRDLTAAPAPDDKEKKEKKQKGVPVPAQSDAPDPVVQASPGAAAAPALGVGFEGVGQGFNGPAGTFSVQSRAPALSPRRSRQRAA